MKKILVKTTIILIVLLSFIVVEVFAQETEPIIKGEWKAINQQIPLTTLGQATTATTNIVVWIYTIFWILAVGFVIWAAFTFMTASGDETKIGEAKTRLTYAVIASAVALLSMGIDLIVKSLLSGS